MVKLIRNNFHDEFTSNISEDKMSGVEIEVYDFEDLIRQGEEINYIVERIKNLIKKDITNSIIGFYTKKGGVFGLHLVQYIKDEFIISEELSAEMNINIKQQIKSFLF